MEDHLRVPCVVKITGKIILEGIKKRLETLIEREQGRIHSGFCRTDQITTRWIISEQCVGRRSPRYMLFTDFENAFYTVNEEYSTDMIFLRNLKSKTGCALYSIIDIIRSLCRQRSSSSLVRRTWGFQTFRIPWWYLPALSTTYRRRPNGSRF